MAETSECKTKSITTKESCSSNAELSEEFSRWLLALKNHLTETQSTTLNTYTFGRRLTVDESMAVLELVRSSCIVDLNVCGNSLEGRIEVLAQTLLSSKIETLSIGCNGFSAQDLLYLMKTLKDTCITKLVIRSCDEPYDLSPERQDEFVFHLLNSHLVVLEIELDSFASEEDGSPIHPLNNITKLPQILPNSSITNLDLSGIIFPFGVLVPLFSILHLTPLTRLNLQGTELSIKDLEVLSFNLRDTKLVSLKLGVNNFGDEELDILTCGLIHSKIVSLSLFGNLISGASIFGLCLKDTPISKLDLGNNEIVSPSLFLFPSYLRFSSITTLDMSRCNLTDEIGQKLMDCLKFSEVTVLNVGCNDLGLLTVTQFAEVLKYTILTEVDFTNNSIPFDGIIKLGDCLEGSKLKVLKLSNNLSCRNQIDPVAYATLIEKSKNSPLESVVLSMNTMNVDGLKNFTASLPNTKFHSLDLSINHFKEGIVFLPPQLKFTSITNLNVASNDLKDAGIEILAKCLKDTKITHLNVCNNGITDSGAAMLASSFEGSSLLELKLCGNKIGMAGLKTLAEHAKGTFITALDVQHNPGKQRFLIDAVMLENQVLVHKFVAFFKRIAPKTFPGLFLFDEILDSSDIDLFLEKCLEFYQIVIEKSSALSVLAQDDSFMYSKEQLATLLKVEFPIQFTSFITNEIEASTSQRVAILKRAEELRLTTVVEYLLLDRPKLMIDETSSILHPYVYKLLHKYNQPLYNLSVEPEGKMKIIHYFTNHPELDGAADIMNLLSP